MYIISSKDINTMFKNIGEFKKYIKGKIKEREIIDIENLNCKKTIKLFIVNTLIPILEEDEYVTIQFFSHGIKKILDNVLKNYFIRYKYIGKNNRTKTYEIYRS